MHCSFCVWSNKPNSIRLYKITDGSRTPSGRFAGAWLYRLLPEQQKSCSTPNERIHTKEK